MKAPSKHPGWILFKDALDILERVESLEHYSNQQSILLDTLLANMEKNID